MSKTTPYQRQERMQSPYTISRAVKTEHGTSVIQLIGVYFEEKFVGEEWKVERTELDLGTHTNLVLASNQGTQFRDDPETFYAEHERQQAERQQQAADAAREAVLKVPGA